MEILLQSGTPQTAEQALDLLPMNLSADPVERAREATLWSKALLAVGEASEAQDWFGRAQEVVQTYHLDPALVNGLTERF